MRADIHCLDRSSYSVGLLLCAFRFSFRMIRVRHLSENRRRSLIPRRDEPTLLVPFPAAAMKIWPISTRMNKPENDDEAILERPAVEGELRCRSS